jgi:helicase
MDQILSTRRGTIDLPAYIPVTTFGEKYPLDDLVRPYLPRLAQGVMVSYHYAKQMSTDDRPPLPLFVDSGGFVSLRSEAEIVERRGLGCIRIERDDDTELVQPGELLDFQERIADVAFTLDFPISPNAEKSEARRRQKLTIDNALWALSNRRRRDLPLFASVQGWDVDSFRACAQAYAGKEFDGIAIGGLVPRSKDKELVLSITRAVRDEIGDRPLHIFGLGHPDLLTNLYDAGATSVDSSSYVQYAASGKLWGSDQKLRNITPTDRLHLALCNLATAARRHLPLSSVQPLFSTFELERQAA